MPLRSTLNIALYDMRKLEYDIRRTVVASDRMMSTNLLKDAYVERLMQQKRTEVFTELVPRPHRRHQSPLPTQRSRASPGRAELPANLRRVADIISLQVKCRQAEQGIKRERRSLRGNFHKVLRGFSRCSTDLANAPFEAPVREEDALRRRMETLGKRSLTPI